MRLATRMAALRGARCARPATTSLLDARARPARSRRCATLDASTSSACARCTRSSTPRWRPARARRRSREQRERDRARSCATPTAIAIAGGHVAVLLNRLRAVRRLGELLDGAAGGRVVGGRDGAHRARRAVPRLPAAGPGQRRGARARPRAGAAASCRCPHAQPPAAARRPARASRASRGASRRRRAWRWTTARVRRARRRLGASAPARRAHDADGRGRARWRGR